MRWKIRRDRLLRKNINRLGLDLSTPPLSLRIAALYRELSARGIRFHPRCYLSNGWGCPDLVPLIGIPFYLARPDLRRIHKEMGYDVEDTRTTMQLLRHEAGHAICYAYQLYRRSDWQKIFGPFHKAYSDHYIPNPFSTQHVIHAKHHYAQKHPDEDFAEAFAVWLAPRSSWRTTYAGTPVIEKLQFVQDIMREIGDAPPRVRGGSKDVPIEEMRFTLLEYYGLHPEEYRTESAAYADQVLRKIFHPGAPPRRGISAGRFLARHRELLIDTISFWAGIDRSKVADPFQRFARRARRLRLSVSRDRSTETLVNCASLLTFFAYTYVHTRKFVIR